MTTMKGTIRSRSARIGDQEKFTVSSSGVASFPIGPPTFQSANIYPELGSTNYSSESGVGITTSTTPSEGFSKLDSWLNTYLLDSPPALTPAGSEQGVGYIQISWTLPVQKKLAFIQGYVPRIETINADVKLSNESDWSNGWTITLQSPGIFIPSVTSLRLMVDPNGASSLANGVYTFRAGSDTSKRIDQAVSYDIRVYAANDAVTSGARQPRYIVFPSLQARSSGTPGAPTNLISAGISNNTASMTWTKPSVNDTINPDSGGYISQYKVTITPTSSARYGGYLTDHPTPQYTVQMAGDNAPTNLILYDLRPGTYYSITVSARNALNSSYGTASEPAIIRTSEPLVPPWSSQLMSLVTSYNFPTGTDGYALDGTTLKSNIFKYVDMVQGKIELTSQTVRTNYTIGDSSAITGVIEAHAGVSGNESVASLNTVGFGHVVPETTVTNGSVTCSVSNESDYYSYPSDGFWKVITARMEAADIASNYKSSDTSYSLFMKFSPAGMPVKITYPISFYVDELENVPNVVSASITGADGVDYITGVPTLIGTVCFQTTIANLANRFLRNDLKHFTATLETSTGVPLSQLVVTKTSMNGVEHKYYTAPDIPYAISTTLHNTTGRQLEVAAGEIQFNTFSLAVDNSTNIFDENVTLRIVPFNLQGSGLPFTKSGCVDTTDQSIKTLRVDGKSIAERDRYTGTNTGTVMQCGSGEFPTAGYTSPMDHSVSISDSDQLQLVGGVWGTRTGYADYTNCYFGGPDYTGIPQTGFRYLCLRFSELNSNTYNKVRIQFESSGLAMDPLSDSANYKLHIKMGDSYWLSCTKNISGSGYNAASYDDAGVMDYTSSSLGDISVYVPTATQGASIMYIRFGLDMEQAQSISNVRISAAE